MMKYFLDKKTKQSDDKYWETINKSYISIDLERLGIQLNQFIAMISFKEKKDFYIP